CAPCSTRWTASTSAPTVPTVARCCCACRSESWSAASGARRPRRATIPLMQDSKRRRATYADIEKLPEHLVGELIGGELLVSARPAPPHARAVTALAADLETRFGRRRGAGGWWILFEPELHLHGDVLVPDIAGWRRERMPNVPRGVGVELAPD